MVGIKCMLQAQQQSQSQRCQWRHYLSSHVGRGLGSMKCAFMPPFPPLFTSRAGQMDVAGWRTDESVVSTGHEPCVRPCFSPYFSAWRSVAQSSRSLPPMALWMGTSEPGNGKNPSPKEATRTRNENPEKPPGSASPPSATLKQKRHLKRRCPKVSHRCNCGGCYAGRTTSKTASKTANKTSPAIIRGSPSVLVERWADRLPLLLFPPQLSTASDLSSPK